MHGEFQEDDAEDKEVHHDHSPVPVQESVWYAQTAILCMNPPHADVGGLEEGRLRLGLLCSPRGIGRRLGSSRIVEEPEHAQARPNLVPLERHGNMYTKNNDMRM
eukprot:TRINITY_DN27717_c0_g1_i2.p3 TRINITY_DN27717_c0_g1~~TRINITY_DN27717_c0_g1_i2.p3  ORF type:complete len:105 (+),score=9.47 TRINITY_DN27717_c0_g1_i2:120-434(+)